MQDGNLSVNDIVTQHAANQGQGATGGASSPNTNVETGKDKGQPAAELPGSGPAAGAAPDPVSDLLREVGVETVDQLKERLKNPEPEKPLTEEEKVKKAEQYEANLQAYAVENGLAKLDDFSRLNELKATADRELVFREFAGRVKEEIIEDNKDRALSDQELETEVRAAFEKEYPLSSTNQKTKARAEAKIAAEATAMRSPLESSLQTVRSKFDDESSLRAITPKYQESLTRVVTSAVPTQVEVRTKDGDQDLVIQVALSEDQQKEVGQKLAARLTSPQTLRLFREGKTGDIEALAKKELDLVLWTDYRSMALEKTAEELLKLGKSRGSTTGATNPFPVTQDKPTATGKKSAADAEQEVLNSLEKKKG